MDEITKLIKEIIKNPKHGFFKGSEKYQKIIEFLKEKHNYLIEPTLKQLIYHEINSLNSIVLCDNCNSEMIWRKNKYQFCSNKKCRTEKMHKKRIITWKEKYGNECPLNNNEIKEKLEKTNIKRYGVKNPIQNKKIREKATQKLKQTLKTGISAEKTKETNNKKYGCDYYFLSEDFKNKREKTMIDLYGTDIPMKISSSKEKILKSNNKNKEKISEKRKQTMLKRYGVEYFLQDENNLKKQQLSGYNYKIHSCGLRYQGSYEEDFLDKYSSKIKIAKPSYLEYTYNNEIHKFFPDFFLPDYNLYVEIKSTYTYNLHKGKNQEKRKLKNVIFIFNRDYTEFEKLILK